MSLETSFCGPMPTHSTSIDVDETVKSLADKLSQKTELAAGAAKMGTPEKATTKSRKAPKESARKAATADSKTSGTRSSYSRENSKHRRKKPSVENPKTQKFVSLHSDEEEEPIASKSVSAKAKPTPTVDNRTQIFIPLHGDVPATAVSVTATATEIATAAAETEKTCEPNPNSPKRLKPFTNSTLVNFISRYDTGGKTRRTRRSTVSESKADYNPRGSINEEFQKFIRLKDDDDDGDGRGSGGLRTKSATPPKHRRSVSNIPTSCCDPPKPSAKQIVVPIQVYQAPGTSTSTNTAVAVTTAPSSSSSPLPAPPPEKPISDLPKYLMTNDGTTKYIPLRGSDSDILDTRQQQSYSNQNYLSVNNKNDIKSLSDDRNLSHLSPLISPNLGRHKPSNLELDYSREHRTRSAKSMTQLINRDESRTPSPNASASNHTRLYRRCSESAKEIRSKPARITVAYYFTLPSGLFVATSRVSLEHLRLRAFDPL